MSSGLIVLVDDDSKFRKLYSDFLTANGFTVVAAASGGAALGLLHNLDPKVLILDIMMPDMDGIETCRRARKIVKPDVPILFLTAAEDMSMVRDCIRAGGDDYLIKTDRLQNVLERVRHWAKSNSRQKSEMRREQLVADLDART